MDVKNELSVIAFLLGEPARAMMLWNLLDGQARTAGELAFFANVSPQSASTHLAKLTEAGMLSVTSAGRQRYYIIARPEVAHVIESMAALIPSPAKNKPQTRAAMPAFRVARTCYDHLAGKLAVEIVASLLKQNILITNIEDFALTENGAQRLREFGIEAEELKLKRRAFAAKCLDWSEREHHLAGALGAAFLQEFLKRRWPVRLNTKRSIRITLEGRKNFGRLFEIHL